MRKNDRFYLHLLAQCQSADLQHRLDALEDLCKHEYLDLIEAQFLLDRLNSTSSEREQLAILSLMCQIEAPLPINALMAILEDWESSTVFLRMEVAHTLAVKKAEEALDLFVRLVLDPEEHPWLRETMTGDLALWGERITDELPLTLLADPGPAVCTAALEVLRDRPPQAISLDLILPYLQREEKSIREAAIKTLMAAEQRVPLDPILFALHDPEPEVRAAASHACMSLVEWKCESSCCESSLLPNFLHLMLVLTSIVLGHAHQAPDSHQSCPPFAEVLSFPAFPRTIHAFSRKQAEGRMNVLLTGHNDGESGSFLILDAKNVGM
jgi:HEAT repeat protein